MPYEFMRTNNNADNFNTTKVFFVTLKLARYCLSLLFSTTKEIKENHSFRESHQFAVFQKKKNQQSTIKACLLINEAISFVKK